MGARGVGMWTASAIQYNVTDDDGVDEGTVFWEDLKVFTAPAGSSPRVISDDIATMKTDDGAEPNYQTGSVDVSESRGDLTTVEAALRVQQQASASAVTFEAVTLVDSAILWSNGQKAGRADPSALSFIHTSSNPDKAIVLIYSSDGTASSNDGGRSFEAVGRFMNGYSSVLTQDPALDGWRTIQGRDDRGVYQRSIAGQVKEAAKWIGKVVPLPQGPWKSAGEWITRPNWSAKQANESTATAVNNSAAHIDTWQAAVGGPQTGSPLVWLSFASGGVAGPLPDGTYVATPVIRYSRNSDNGQQQLDCQDYSPDGKYNHTHSYCQSVVAYVSDKSGRNWTMRSTIASPKDMLKGNPRLPHCPSATGCEEGPNENSISKNRMCVLLRWLFTVTSK